MAKTECCATCFCSRVQSHKDWIGKVAGGGPDGDTNDPINWSEYETVHCHRYPKSEEVSDSHWCFEYQPDSIGGEEVESESS